MELVLTQNNGTTTMTSLQLVEFVNHLRRQEGNGTFTELTHFNFLQKVKEVLKGGELNFKASYKSLQNKDLPMHVFPKREAMLMAMSYSYDIQAVVYDAWEKAEKALLQLKRNPITIAKTRKILSNFCPTREGILGLILVVF